jgi:hypothetical protein
MQNGSADCRGDLAAPTHDKQRGTDGETVWVHSEGHWNIGVGELRPAEGVDFPETVKIGGLEFWYPPVGGAPSLDNKTIDYSGGEFIVR